MVAVPYLLLDVFTDQPYTGNPLAVVPFPPQRLTTQAMQSIATEFNLSETVFIYPPEESGHTASLRIFTPTQELPFAGHPTVGAAVALGLLAERGQFTLANEMELILGEKIGPVPVTLERQRGRATLTTAQLPERGPSPVSRVQLAETLALPVDEVLDEEDCQPAAFSCGVPFLFVPLRSRKAVDRARVNTGAWEKYLEGTWAPNLFVFAFDPLHKDHHVYGRMFGPEKGIVEDPATGSAAAAFAGFLFAHAQNPEGRWVWKVEQGVAMGRPSLLEISIDAHEGRLQRVQVGGQAVLVGEGQLLQLPE